ncbi:MAG: hypothetical protein H7242_05175, partial [Microbacteriaceae bacterium]|nr:hypothetical protein [Burkholderiaceae bacterium]
MPDRGPAPRPGAPGRGRRGFWGLAVAVVALHLLLSNHLLETRVGWGSGDKLPPRIDVSFVQVLKAAEPAPLAAPAPTAPAEKRLPAVAAQPQASAPAPRSLVDPPATADVAVDKAAA